MALVLRDDDPGYDSWYGATFWADDGKRHVICRLRREVFQDVMAAPLSPRLVKDLLLSRRAAIEALLDRKQQEHPRDSRIELTSHDLKTILQGSGPPPS